MRKLTDNVSHDISANQHSLAISLGIDCGNAITTHELVELIESRLGDRILHERSRWFVMSVLRHLLHEDWAQPEQSGLELAFQYELAEQCMDLPGFTQSINTVLKGDACKYCLVEFRRARNVPKAILGNTTVAYRCAEQVVNNAQPGAASAAAEVPKAQHQPGAKLQKMDKPTASLRRASRRGFASRAALQVASNTDAALQSRPTPERQLSQEEYAELDQVLTQQEPTTRLQRSWLQFGNDESRSWFTGLLAGFALFALVLWLIL